MPTTIKIKNGSGAPTSSDLVQGELAIDLTNKRLYTEDGSANILELGTSPSTIDINAGTIDGTVIGGASAAAGTFTTANATTVDTTNIEVTNVKAKDGTASATIADSTGVMTIASSVLTTTDINGGTIDGTVIGGASAAAGTFTTATATTGNITTVNATTVDSTNVEVTNIKAKDGTASATIADSTGVMTVSSAVLTTADINGGTIDGVTIGGASAGAGTFTTLTGSGDMNIDSGTLFVDASADAVGIGTTSPVAVLTTVASSNYSTTWNDLTGSGIHIASTGTSASGNYGGALTFGNITSTTDRQGAAIAAVQDTADADQIGLAFFTHPSEFTTQPLAEAMRISSSGNLGLGVTPSAWSGVGGVFELKGNAYIGSTTNSISLASNAYFNGSNWIYKSTAAANLYSIDTGQHKWFNAASGTAGNAISFTQAMTLDASGNLMVGKTTTSAGSAFVKAIDVQGTLAGTFYASATDGGTVTGLFSGDAFADIVYVGSTTNHPVAFLTNNTVKATIDSSGNLGLGVTPSAWNSTYKAFQVGSSAALWSIGSGAGGSYLTNNVLFDSSFGRKYIVTGNATEYTQLNGQHQWFTAASGTAGNAISFTQAMTLDASGNLLVGGTTAGTASAGNLVLFNGTAPTGNVTNGITLYAEDVSASSELKVRDEAGNITTLSPHNFDLIPEGPSEDMAWSYYSERDGKRINVDMLKAIRLLEQLTGEKLVHTN